MLSSDQTPEMGKINPQELNKLYYTIGEVADMFDVNTSLIRFWEKEFPTIQPKKNKKGNRLFTSKEIAKIDRIYTLVKEEGYTLDGAKKAMKSKAAPSTAVTPEVKANDHEDVINRLEAIKAKLNSLRN